jgi:hypothetical protein
MGGTGHINIATKQSRVFFLVIRLSEPIDAHGIPSPPAHWL